MKFHCFFEQSGTFKNEFKKLGFESFDYDILNDFNETDYIIDLFEEIEKGYLGLYSIFDKFNKNKDFIIAFFPCIRFEEQILLHFRGEAFQDRNKPLKQKISQDMKLHDELHNLYSLFCKLIQICIEKDIPIVIENPYSEQHYLKRYFCIRPSIIDSNRQLNGDSFKKPTQYWFINCEPQQNIIFEPLEQVKIKKVNKCNKVERSMIQPQYARRFIKEFIIKKEWNNE